MKKIAITGLQSIPNMGDKILCDTAKFLVEEIRPDFEVIEVDVSPREKSYYRGIHRITFIIHVFMRKAAKLIFKYEHSGYFRYYYEKFMWSLRIEWWYKNVFRDIDAIIIAGGGFLKFRTQGLNYFVELIIKYARKYSIPVMFNAVGIEGYDDTDIRCIRLKEVINDEHVKVITTRDYIEVLDTQYITNKDIITSQVGDPALWIPECYKYKKNENTELIGINVIRSDIYIDYGTDFSPNELKKFYIELLQEAEKRDIKWVLFSNGMEKDQMFGRELLNKLNLSIEEKLLPAPKKPVELLELLSNFKSVFGARLHACISSYSLDIPVTGIIWNEKLKRFSEMIDQENCYFDVHELDAKSIMDSLLGTDVITYNNSIRQVLRKSTREYIVKFLEASNL